MPDLITVIKEQGKVLVITGPPASGKSILAKQLAYGIVFFILISASSLATAAVNPTSDGKDIDDIPVIIQGD